MTKCKTCQNDILRKRIDAIFCGKYCAALDWRVRNKEKLKLYSKEYYKKYQGDGKSCTNNTINYKQKKCQKLIKMPQYDCDFSRFDDLLKELKMI